METITKFDAAIRNLRAAIRLFFEGGDSVAVHTLASAAQGVIRDVAKANGFANTSVLHDHPGVRPEDRKKWIQGINAPRNFFKHADRDPNGKLDFDGQENVLVLFDATVVLSQFTLEPVQEANVFMGWFTTAHPDMRAAISNNVVGDYCVRNAISPTDLPRFRELCDSQILIDGI